MPGSFIVDDVKIEVLRNSTICNNLGVHMEVLLLFWLNPGRNPAYEIAFKLPFKTLSLDQKELLRRSEYDQSKLQQSCELCRQSICMILHLLEPCQSTCFGLNVLNQP